VPQLAQRLGAPGELEDRSSRPIVTGKPVQIFYVAALADATLPDSCFG
jgi:hypothetical protein